MIYTLYYRFAWNKTANFEENVYYAHENLTLINCYARQKFMYTNRRHESTGSTQPGGRGAGGAGGGEGLEGRGALPPHFSAEKRKVPGKKVFLLLKNLLPWRLDLYFGCGTLFRSKVCFISIRLPFDHVLNIAAIFGWSLCCMPTSSWPNSETYT